MNFFELMGHADPARAEKGVVATRFRRYASETSHPLRDSRSREGIAIERTVDGNGFAGSEVVEFNVFRAVLKDGVMCDDDGILLEAVDILRLLGGSLCSTARQCDRDSTRQHDADSLLQPNHHLGKVLVDVANR